MLFSQLAILLCCFILLMNCISAVIMSNKCRARPRSSPAPTAAPPVSIIRPLRGIETFSEETLESLFRLNYPNYEIIFCVQSNDDPIIPIVNNLLLRHPNTNAKMLIGDDRISANPKLNNCIKGWDAAQYDYILLSDSNVLAPADYIQTMLMAFCQDTALTISMPIGSRPGNFWAVVECAMLNTFQARWQYGADSLGYGFAQGKNMMWRREVLDRVGGIGALACEIAEDAAATKVVRAQNMRIRLVDMPFEQPLGSRSFMEVYSRHARWARLRRATFPWHYAPEFMNGSFIAVLLGAYASNSYGYNPLIVVFIILILMYSSELWLARRCGFYSGPMMPLALIIRDIILPVMFIDGLFIDDFVWHGEVMNVREETDALST